MIASSTKIPARTAPRNAGFTLLEVVIALAILTVGILAVMQLFPRSLRQMRAAAEGTTIASFANTELGQARATSGAQNIASDLSTWLHNLAARNTDAVAKADALYKGWETSVHRMDSTVDLFRITLSIETFDGRHENFTTYVTSY